MDSRWKGSSCQLAGRVDDHRRVWFGRERIGRDGVYFLRPAPHAPLVVMHLIRICLTCAIVALSLPTAVAHAQASPEAVRLDALAAEALALGQSPLGLAPVLEMSWYSEWLSPEARLALYDRVARGDVHPATRAMARYAGLRIVSGAGDWTRAATLEAEQGFVTQWALIGPFPNDGMGGMAQQFAPETDGMFDEDVDGKVVPVRWRDFDRVSETGYFAVSDLAVPAHDAVAYVATEFDVARRTDATLSVAVDGAYRIWLDGEPLVARDEHLGGFVLRDFVDVSLARGRHTLLVKMGADDDPLGLHARFLDGRGAPIALEYRPATSLVPAAQTDVWPRPRGIADVLSDALEGETDGDALASAAMIARELHPEDPAQPWREFSERALAASPTALGYRRLAQAADEGWRREERLRQALEVTDEPLAQVEWATARFRQMGEAGVEEAAAVIAPLLATENPPLTARVLSAMILGHHAFYQAQYEELNALAQDAPTAQSVIVMRIEAARATYRRQELADLLYARLADAAGVVGVYDDLVAIERARGNEAAVTELLEQLALSQPLSPAAAEQEAWIHFAVDDRAGVEAAVDRALALAPGSAELLALRAEFALAWGDTSGAADALESALARRPQDQSLRDLLQRIAPSGDRFFEEYRLSNDEILALRPDENSDAAYTTLLNQQATRVFPNGLATRWVQRAFDVHTRSGADALRSLQLGYTPDAELVEVLSVNVVKPDGRVLEVFDSNDYGSGSGPSSIYYDVHARVLAFMSLEVGDVLIYEYTLADVAYQNMFDDYFGDMWFVEDNVPQRRIRYALHAPTAREIYTSEPVAGGSWEERVVGDETVRVFTAEDVPAVRRESRTPGPAESFGYLSVSTYPDWDSLGNWYWNLIRDQLIAGPEIVATVERLIEGVDDRRDQIAAIYGYVVRNTRYVGLEFGIHGYKPYRTTDCFNRRFGDCKDTASLMKVMLGVAGIDAHLALVRTRDMGRVNAFPPSLALFNHAITYVPEFDLFLDGTAGFSGSTELPTADQGASALIVRDGEGAEFRTIAASDGAGAVRRVEWSVDLTGPTPVGTGDILLTGAFAPSIRTAYESPQRRVERLESELSSSFAGLELQDATFVGVDDIESPVSIAFDFEGGDWARAQGADWVVSGPTADSLTAAYAGASTRTLPIDLGFAFRKEQVLTVHVPAGWQLSQTPEDERIESPFGSAQLTTTFENGTLRTALSVTIDRIRIQPDEYEEFRQFTLAVDAALGQVVRFQEAR